MTQVPMTQIDSQKVELIGRNWLVNELLRAGLEVATPIRDRGIDLIAYVDLARNVERFIARPIQMKAATRQDFDVNRKFARIADLLIAYVWNLADPGKTCAYAMTYPEAVGIAETMGWTRTKSWKYGGYGTRSPSKKLRVLLEPHLMSREKWWATVTGLKVLDTNG